MDGGAVVALNLPHLASWLSTDGAGQPIISQCIAPGWLAKEEEALVGLPPATKARRKSSMWLLPAGAASWLHPGW